MSIHVSGISWFSSRDYTFHRMIYNNYLSGVESKFVTNNWLNWIRSKLTSLVVIKILFGDSETKLQSKALLPSTLNVSWSEEVTCNQFRDQ